MNKLIKNIIAFFVSFFICTITFAQNQTIEMADGMRSNGKIYIVVAVCLTILFGLFFYLLILDKKISTLEK